MIRRAKQMVIATGGVALWASAGFAEPVPVPVDPDEPITTDTAPTTDDTQIPDPHVPSDPTDTTATTTLIVVPDDPSYRMANRRHTRTTTEQHGMFGRMGFALSAGGGISGFTNDTARGATNDGGGWDVRATFGTNLPLAAEISYIGSAQGINALGLDNDALLVGNGVQANLRLNLGVSRVQPFLFGGAAWRHYELANTDTNTSSVAESDNVIEFPVGAGLAYRYGGVIFDARGEFRPTTEEDLMPRLAAEGLLEDDDEAALHRWGVNATLGVEF